MSLIFSTNSSKYNRIYRALLWAVALPVGFAVYIIGIGSNPPGFYVDESGFAFNGYLVSTTGHGEFGTVGTIFFQFYTDIFIQYAAPTLVYMLALVFSIFGPSILAARVTMAATMFAACVLTGVLAARISGRKLIGIIVGLSALSMPWLFEVGRLVLETWLYPLSVILFLTAVYRVHKKEKWTLADSLLIGLPLILLTYSYTIGRLFGPLMALGLIILVTNRERLIAVLLTWSGYALTLIPILLFARSNPDFTNRFYMVSYIKKYTKISEIITKFVPRYFEELNPWSLVSIGDDNARHHLPHAMGSIFIATFVFAVIGLTVIAICHRTNRFWMFIVYGFLASIIPGAITMDHAHTLRLIAYPIFFLMLTVPALEWFFEQPEVRVPEETAEAVATSSDTDITFGEIDAGRPLLWGLRPKILVVASLLILTMVQGGYFHYKNYTEGARRSNAFDVSYKQLYDMAVAQPERPIYLFDEQYGPFYVHAFWYAITEGRDQSELHHVLLGEQVPAGALVLSSEADCRNCEKISKEDTGILYRSSEARFY